MRKMLFYILVVFLISACSVNTKQFMGSEADKKETKGDSNLEKIAIIIPQRTIKSYSNIIINSSIAYLIRQKSNLKTTVFLIETEQEDNIQRVLEQIKAQSYHFVIAGVTLKGANYLAKHSPSNLKIYIPTLHKSSTQIQAPNIYFGGIDYDKQIEELLKRGNSNVAVFYDSSALSSNLEEKLTRMLRENLRKYRVEGEKLDFNKILRSGGSLNNATIFLNTPIVKSSIIISQIRANGTKPNAILSTQISYNPALLRLTQSEDRARMFVANSIHNKDKDLSFINEIFEQSLDYNWLVYTTSVGLDYFYTQEFSKIKRIFKEDMKDMQIIYDVKLMRSLNSNFE